MKGPEFNANIPAPRLRLVIMGPTLGEALADQSLTVDGDGSGYFHRLLFSCLALRLFAQNRPTAFSPIPQRQLSERAGTCQSAKMRPVTRAAPTSLPHLERTSPVFRFSVRQASIVAESVSVQVVAQ